ncbi:nuclear transport factor 2 family protein [Neorhizobium galegae]|uniref:nuclear transport factor 2 family protein n=1 Tax=Neorhizobium galegae TaxID=399 RepID=UPI002102E657|nr:nuclear transport factor 2 family protein [Neorhizobium galegae]MCQ1775830.1 nuclear transport factor 2 family protein [Neorhizobium galegae]MCQ1797995.1 nuclear transport factor 2 family protein [Neorhizobium galegae]
MQDDTDAFGKIATRKAQYCRYVDTKRWEVFRELFSDVPDIRFVDTEGNTINAFTSVEEFVTISALYLDGAQTIHQVHNAEMERISDDQVNAIWSMEDYLLFPAVEDARPASMHGYGHYHETWKFEAGQWRIAKLELRRTILEIRPKEPVQ